MANEEVTMMMSVVPGAMTGISTMMSGLVSINNVFLDMTRQIDATFGLIDSSIVTAGTVVAQFGLKAAEAFGEFEQGMKIVQMVSNQTASDMDILKQKANEFSVSYRTDIDQITEGLQTLGRAGLNSASEQTEVLQNGLSTAKLESRELNSVLEELIQNTALLGGNLKTSDFGEASTYLNDILVATSMTAPITTHDISETLKYSGGIAAAAGANVNTDEGKAILEDYMAAIAAFAQKGVTGSIAGTALRAFLNKPATQDSSVVDALASLHLKPEYLWEDGGETMKPISEQIGIIKGQMDALNVSTMDQLQIWSKIVGGKMGQQMMKLDSDTIKDITKDIQAADSAQSKAAGTFQTFQASMKEMTEQGQVAFREFGKRVAFVMNPLIELITKFLEVLSNPVASTTLFVGFISLLGQAAQRIKRIFNTLKNEFSEFKKAFMGNEKLMAMRPSYERYHGRRGGGVGDLMTYHQEIDPAKAFEKEFKLKQAEAKLSRGKDNDFTPAMYALFDKTFNKQFSKEFDAKQKTNDLYPSEIRSSEAYNILSSIFETTNEGIKRRRTLGLDKTESKLNWGFVIRELMTRGLWQDKWSDAFFNPERPLSEKEFITNFGQEMLDALVNSYDYKKIRQSQDAKKEAFVYKKSKDRRDEIYSMFHLFDDTEDDFGLRKSVEQQMSSALNRPTVFAQKTHDSESKNKIIKNIIDQYFVKKESIAGAKPEIDELNYFYNKDDLSVIRTQLRTIDRHTGKEQTYLYDKIETVKTEVEKEADSIMGTYMNEQAERAKESLYYMLRVYEDVFYGSNDIGPSYFALMSVDEIRKKFTELTGKKYLEVSNDSIKDAQRLVGINYYGSEKKYERMKKDSDSQSTEITSFGDRFDQPYYRDYLRGYRTTKRFGPTGEWEEVIPKTSAYFNIDTGKREQLSKKQYRMIKDTFEERQYFKDTLFLKMKQQQEMDDMDINAFVLMSHRNLEYVKGAFQDKEGKPLTYKLPYNLLTSDRELDYNEFTYLRLNDKDNTRVSEVLANMSPSRRREEFEGFKEEVERRRKAFQQLKDVAGFMNLYGTDSFIPKLDTSKLNLKHTNEDSKMAIAIADVFGYQLFDNEGRQKIMDEGAIASKKAFGQLRSKLSKAGNLGRFEKIDLSEIEGKGVSEYKVLQNLAKMFGVKANQSAQVLKTELESIINDSIAAEKMKVALYKEFGNAYRGFDDTELLKEIQAFKEWQERQKNYNIHMEDNPYAGTTPGSYGSQTEDVLKYQKEQEEKEQREKEERNKRILDELKEENLSLLGDETRRKGHKHIEKQKEMNENLKKDIENLSSPLTDPSKSKSSLQELVEKHGYGPDHGLKAMQLRKIEAKVRDEGLESLSFEELNKYAEKNNVSQKYLRTMKKIDESREKLERGLARIDKDWEELGYKGITNIDERSPKDRPGAEEIFDVKELKENLISLPSVSKEMAEANMLYNHKDFISKLNDPKYISNLIKNFSLSDYFKEQKDKLELKEKGKGFLDKHLFRPRSDDRLIGSSDPSRKWTNAVGNVVDLMGGPMMVAMEAYSYAINYVQGLYDDYCEALQNAISTLKQAYSDISSTESALQRAYMNNTEGATNEDAEQYILDMYDQIQKDFQNGDWLKKANIDVDKLSRYQYDEESDKYQEVEEEEKTDEESYKEAIDKNTGALYEAIGQLQLAMDSLTTQQMDNLWGMDGASSQISDAIGLFQDKWMGEGSSFVDNGFLLTASQKDSNYPGNKEFAGLLMEDLYDAKGDLQKGLNTIFGSDSKDILLSMDPKGQKVLEGFAKAFGPTGMSRRSNLRLQNSMMNDKKSWQALAKEIGKYQLKGGTWKNLVKGTDIKRLEGYVKKLATETGLSRLQILQGAALQQMQDMYQVAEEKIIPLSAQQAEAAAAHYVYATSSQYPVDKNTEAGTFGIQNIAAVIASMVSVIAQAKAGEAYYQQELANGNPDAVAAGSADEFIKKGMDKNYSFDSFVKSIPGVGGVYSVLENNLPNEYTNLAKGLREKTLFTISGDKNIQAGHFMTFQTMAEQSRNPDMTWDEAYEYAKKKSEREGLISTKKVDGKDVITIQDGISYATLMKTARENYGNAITPSLIEQYMGSQLGEVGDSGSGGSGSGSGSGNKDKDTGTKKERVDLVLCNKKEIPKLNVNLFKKAPSFTILNKNFKLRDIKVNTQDKPKAVLASIKNAIIDVQKRTDPKIIQDEEAIYDPVGATDGNTPSGTSDVRTDSN